MTDTLAIDPGMVTGYALHHHKDSDFYSDQIEGRFAFERLFDGLVDGYIKSLRHLRVVMEDFVIGGDTIKKSRQVDPHRIIGYVEGRCSYYGIEFSLQTPATAKKYATNEKLKALGWYNATPGGHANDAARHLLVRLTRDPDIAPALNERLVEGLGL